jgi:hypothetical protein
LELSNGEKTVEAIFEALYERYGQDMEADTFFDSCVEAVKVLGEERLLETGQPGIPPWKGGEYNGKD